MGFRKQVKVMGLLVSGLILGMTQYIYGQNNQTVSGMVTNAQSSGEPISNVNIVVRGTNRGTSTNAQGHYSLQVPSLQDTLVFSFIGYKSKVVPVRGRTEINVQLQSTAIVAEELIVVGYGTQEREDVSGSIDVVSAEELTNRPSGNVGNLLEGTSPNLRISMNNYGGEPGHTANLSIRGIGSISGNDSPLILVDGVPMDLSQVNPNNIESISVLKDASAAALYGSRGAFGVVLITTKSGQSGEMKVQYSNNFSFRSPIALPHMANSLIWATAYNQASKNAGEGLVYSQEQLKRIKGYLNGTFSYEYDPDNPPNSLWNGRDIGNANYDWPDVFMKDFSLRQTHNLSFSGGGQNVTYYTSLGYLDENGMYTYGNGGYKRYNLLANVSSQVTEWLNFDISTRFIQSRTNYPIGITTVDRRYSFGDMLTFAPMTPFYNINGSIYMPYVRNYQDAGRNKTKVNDLLLNLQATLEPLKNWSIRVSYNYHLKNEDNMRNPKPVWVELGTGGVDNIGKPVASYEKTSSQNVYRKFNVRSTYQITINNHFIKILAGFEQQQEQYSSLFGKGKLLIAEEVPSISTALGAKTVDDSKGHWATRGIFARLNYNFKDTYFVQFSGRYNGSSRFAKNNRWGLFPAVAASYVISNEKFWNPLKKYINFFKLRASYGSLGNQNVANYLYLSNIPVYSQLGWIINGNLPAWASTPNLISLHLTWETVTTLNIGLNAGFFDNRLQLTFDWYRRKTTDMIGPAQSLPGVLGTSAPKTNNAALATKGFEIELSWRDRISQDFSYRISASLGDNKTTILQYKNEAGLIDTWYEGKKVGEIWGFKTAGIIQSENENIPDQSAIYSSWGPGDIEYQDLNGDGKITEGARTLDNHGDLTVIGNSRPRYNFGIQAGFKWKGFNFSMLWQGIGKRDYYPRQNSPVYWGLTGAVNGSGIYSNSWTLDYWRPADETNRLGPNTDAYFPKPYFSSETLKNRRPQTRYLLSTAYIRLKNITVGYTLPQELFGGVIQKAKIYISASDLITFSSLPDNMAPERQQPLSDAINYGIYPTQKSISFGVNITF